MASIKELFGTPPPTGQATTPPPGPLHGPPDLSPYAVKALQSEADRVATATQGIRNQTLNTAAFRMGQLVAGGLIDPDTVTRALADAARATGLPEAEIQTVLRAGPTGGLQQATGSPRNVPEDQSLVGIATVTETAPEAIGGPVEVPDHSTWWPVPLAEAHQASQAQPAPTHLIRDDGQPLLYSGKVNGLIGESESGKSWIALLAITQALNAGQTVFMLDFEDSPASIHQRMDSMGLTADELGRFHYANPDQALDAVARADLAQALQRDYQVIVVDGVNAAMTLLGWELNSNTDATLFTTRILKPLTTTGACVISVDHVPKNVEQRAKGGIGAQAKRAMMDGCALTVTVKDPFGKGQSGKLHLAVDKDRPGHIRGAAADGKHAGDVYLESVADQVRIHIQAPAKVPAAEKDPIATMVAISNALAGLEKPLTFRQVKQMVSGRDQTIRQAVAALIRLGHVQVRQGARGALVHHLVTRFEPEKPVS